MDGQRTPRAQRDSFRRTSPAPWLPSRRFRIGLHRSSSECERRDHHRHLARPSGRSLSGARFGRLPVRNVSCCNGRRRFARISSRRSDIGRPIRSFECIAHRQGGMLLIEMLPIAVPQTLNVTVALQGPLSRFACEDSILGIANRAAAEIRRASGFERVMTINSTAIGMLKSSLRQARPCRRLLTLFPAGISSSRAPLLSNHDPAHDRGCRCTARRIGPPRTRKPAWRHGSVTPILRSSAPSIFSTCEYMVSEHDDALALVRGESWGMIVAHHGLSHRLLQLARRQMQFVSSGPTTAAHILPNERIGAGSGSVVGRVSRPTWPRSDACAPPPGEDRSGASLELALCRGLVVVADGRDSVVAAVGTARSKR